MLNDSAGKENLHSDVQRKQFFFSVTEFSEKMENITVLCVSVG